MSLFGALEAQSLEAFLLVRKLSLPPAPGFRTSCNCLYLFHTRRFDHSVTRAFSLA